jgi:hypothetical protein
MSEKSIVKLHKNKKVFAPIMYKVHKSPGQVTRRVTATLLTEDIHNPIKTVNLCHSGFLEIVAVVDGIHNLARLFASDDYITERL